LIKRFAAAQQRCQNPNDKGFENYGGRGIEFRFPSVVDAALWAQKSFKLEDMLFGEIDREDNDGHYEASNIRIVTRIANSNNKQATIYFKHGRVKIPAQYAPHVVRYLWPDVLYSHRYYDRLYYRGCRTLKDIRDHYHNVWSDKPKGCTTLPTVDLDIVSRYLPEAKVS
jgi:hypothetical protein